MIRINHIANEEQTLRHLYYKSVFSVLFNYYSIHWPGNESAGGEYIPAPSSLAPLDINVNMDNTPVVHGPPSGNTTSKTQAPLSWQPRGKSEKYFLEEKKAEGVVNGVG